MVRDLSRILKLSSINYLAFNIQDNYFAVQGWMVTELKLKGNALMLYAIIYGFSQTTNTAFTGSVDYLCEWLGGVSRPTVINTLDNLVKQGLLTKSSTT